MQLHCCTLCDTHTLIGKLRLLFFYCTMNSFPTVNSLPTMNSMMHALWKTSPRYLTQLCCCTLCDACTLFGELFSLFFFCTMNSFPTVNSVMHTLKKFSPCYLTQLCCCTLCDAHTACGKLCLFFFFTMNSFWPWTFYWLWTLWNMHSRKLSNIFQNTSIVLHTYV